MKEAGLFSAALLALLTMSCASQPPNVRQQMLESSRREDPHFPDGAQQKLTQFAYIGDVKTKSSTLRVVWVRSVLTGMPAPRGETWLSFFDEHGHFIGRKPIDIASPPLWCEGSRVYFFGVQTNGEQRGNALDVGNGLSDLQLVSQPAAGSWLP